MDKLYISTCTEINQVITRQYSTSFYSSVLLLDKDIQRDIFAIYGFVRIADEIVDSFEGYPQKELFEEFEIELDKAINRGISTNPIINAFIEVVKRCKIDRSLIDGFMYSMRCDLSLKSYCDRTSIDKYIYGSAEVVGLMCLRVFTQETPELYDKLKEPARKLGSAFQKVNFLRDLKDDSNRLERSYFPEFTTFGHTEDAKSKIIAEIEEEFNEAFEGLIQLPKNSRLGVLIAYNYYRTLLDKIKQTNIESILNNRLRLPNYHKMAIMAKSLIENIITE
ncbi:MAG: phytoene/squalene synthase family protein [Bacteroidales bacterium]